MSPLGTSSSGTMVVRKDDEIASDPGTMVYAGSTGPADDTMMKHNNDIGSYKPAFLAHFESNPVASNTDVSPALIEGESSLPSQQQQPPPAMTLDELQQKMQLLELEKEQELDELRRLYQAKREPIIQALEAKRAVTPAASS